MDEQAVYCGSLWGSGKDRQPGRPLNVQRRFIWAGRPLYVPAVYLCAEGIVIDLCRRVDPEAIRRSILFYNKPGAEPTPREE